MGAETGDLIESGLKMEAAWQGQAGLGAWEAQGRRAPPFFSRVPWQPTGVGGPCPGCCPCRWCSVASARPLLPAWGAPASTPLGDRMV